MLPHALEQVRKLKTTVDENNFEELFRLLGTSNTSRPVHGDEGSRKTANTRPRSERWWRRSLKADGSGQLVKFPFINNQLQRILCRWAYKLCTAGGFRLPAFALADDGYLVLHNGRVYSGSDWMPENHRDHEPRLGADVGGSLSDPGEGRSAPAEETPCFRSGSAA